MSLVLSIRAGSALTVPLERETTPLAGLPAARAPSALWVCAQLPRSPVSLCHSEHSSTQPSLMLALPVSAGGRTCHSEQEWPENLHALPSCLLLSPSGGVEELCWDAGRTRKDRHSNMWPGKCSSGSWEPPLRQSLGLLSGSLSHHWSLLQESHFVIVEMYWRRVFSHRRKIKLTWNHRKMKNY